MLAFANNNTSQEKKYTLENIAGYIDVDAIKKSKLLQIVHNLVCPTYAYTYAEHRT